MENNKVTFTKEEVQKMMMEAFVKAEQLKIVRKCIKKL